MSLKTVQHITLKFEHALTKVNDIWNSAKKGGVDDEQLRLLFQALGLDSSENTIKEVKKNAATMFDMTLKMPLVKDTQGLLVTPHRYQRPNEGADNKQLIFYVYDGKGGDDGGKNTILTKYFVKETTDQTDLLYLLLDIQTRLFTGYADEIVKTMGEEVIKYFERPIIDYQTFAGVSCTRYGNTSKPHASTQGLLRVTREGQLVQEQWTTQLDGEKWKCDRIGTNGICNTVNITTATHCITCKFAKRDHQKWRCTWIGMTGFCNKVNDPKDTHCIACNNPKEDRSHIKVPDDQVPASATATATSHVNGKTSSIAAATKFPPATVTRNAEDGAWWRCPIQDCPHPNSVLYKDDKNRVWKKQHHNRKHKAEEAATEKGAAASDGSWFRCERTTKDGLPCDLLHSIVNMNDANKAQKKQHHMTLHKKQEEREEEKARKDRGEEKVSPGRKRRKKKSPTKKKKADSPPEPQHKHVKTVPLDDQDPDKIWWACEEKDCGYKITNGTMNKRVLKIGHITLHKKNTMGSKVRSSMATALSAVHNSIGTTLNANSPMKMEVDATEIPVPTSPEAEDPGGSQTTDTVKDDCSRGGGPPPRSVTE